MDYKGEPVYTAVAIGVQNPRFHPEPIDYIEKVICAQLLRSSGQRCADHRLHNVHPHWPTFQPGAVVHHHGDFPGTEPDRKSTRLNSSHVRISYAVFCLKKKTQ